MAEQLAYPSAMIEDTGVAPGSWAVVDPTLQANSADEVLRDGSDSTYIESDGAWAGAGTPRPSVLMRVQTLAGKLPLRRPYIGATVFRLRFRYRIVGSGVVGTGPLLEATDFTTDHVNVSSVPFPGRRKVMIQQTFTSELIADGQLHELEVTLPSSWLKGHEDGCKSIGGIPVIDSDLGMRISVPEALTGAPRLQITQAWFRVDEVERYESLGADFTVRRTGAKSFVVEDTAGLWAANGGGAGPYTNQLLTGISFSDSTKSSQRNGITAVADACRRALLTKSLGGNGVVEIAANCYSGSLGSGGIPWEHPNNQPTFEGLIIGYDDGASQIYKCAYAPTGTPSAPIGSVRNPVDGLVIRSEVVPDGYRDGDKRASFATSELKYWDKVGSTLTYVEHGTSSLYGIRLWCVGQASFFADFASGKPFNVTALDLHDVQVTGEIVPNSSGGPTNGGHEYKWGFRIGGLRIDFRRVVWGTGLEHCCYGTSPSGDSQIVDSSNTVALAFYPGYANAFAPLFAPQTVAHITNSWHQFVNRINSCTNNGNPPGSTPPGAGTLLVENCVARGTLGTHFKSIHTLGSIINRRCRSIGKNGTQRSVQFTLESFGDVQQATTTTIFGGDYSRMSYAGIASQTTCTKGGGSSLPPSNVPYPQFIEYDSAWTYGFDKIVVEDLQASGPHANTVVQISGAREVIIDRGSNSTGKWPFFGFYEWNWFGQSSQAYWYSTCGPFDNNDVLFRNIGPDPHAYYGAPVTSNGGSTVSRLITYGSRLNPNRPGGATTNPAYATITQIQGLTQTSGAFYPPWYQTQKIESGTLGAELGHNWLYPCVLGPPDFTDPEQYGAYFGNARRYPPANRIDSAVRRTREIGASATVTLGTGGAVSVNAKAFTRQRFAQAASAVLDVYAVGAAVSRLRDRVTATVSIEVNVTAGQFTRPREIVFAGVGLEDTLDFSLYPARIEFRVGSLDIVTDAAATIGTHTGGVSGAGAFEGGSR